MQTAGCRVAARSIGLAPSATDGSRSAETHRHAHARRHPEHSRSEHRLGPPVDHASRLHQQRSAHRRRHEPARGHAHRNRRLGEAVQRLVGRQRQATRRPGDQGPGVAIDESGGRRERNRRRLSHRLRLAPDNHRSQRRRHRHRRRRYHRRRRHRAREPSRARVASSVCSAVCW